MGRFYNNPALKRSTVYERGHDPKRPWVLQEPLKYYSGTLGKTVVVPMGYRSDFASVPWFFRRVFPQAGPWALAAVVHDWMVTKKMHSSTVAALGFREAM